MYQLVRRRGLSLLAVILVVAGPLAVINGKLIDQWLSQGTLSARKFWWPESPAAAGAPAAVDARRSTTGVSSVSRGGWDAAGATPGAGSLAPAAMAAGPMAPPPQAYSLPLTDFLRFDLTPAAIRERWPRVSPVLSDFSHSALRTPLVTGRAPQDIVGVLTYYFDDKEVMQRIALDGTTKDPAPLEQFVANIYRLERTKTSDNLFLNRPEVPLSASMCTVMISCALTPQPSRCDARWS